MKQIIIDNMKTDYDIDEQGNIFSHKTKKFLTGSVFNTGYLMVRLTVNGIKKGYAVHRLVAKAFIPNPDNLPVVNHIDGDKTNNNLSNLEVCSKSENALHSCYVLKHNIKPVIQIKDNENIEYPSISEAARQLNITNSAIVYALKNNTKCCQSYWKYK